MGDYEIPWHSNRPVHLWSHHASCFRIHRRLLFQAFCSTADQANFSDILVAPVFWFTTPALGGFGFNPFQISMFLGTVGLCQALWLLFAFPPLQKKLGTKGVLRACSIVWPFTFVVNPICNMLLRNDWKVAFWTIAPTSLVLGSSVSMAFSKWSSPATSSFAHRGCLRH